MHHFRLVLSLLVCVAGVAARAVAQERQPNMIVILTDDQGFTDLGIQGVRDDIKTPHIDALATGGVRMTSGYITAPQCVPSRAGLITGRYQTRFGVEANGMGPLPLSERTIADRLTEAGYVTGMVGKWQLTPNYSDLDFLREYDPDVTRQTGRAALGEVPGKVRAQYRTGRRGFQDFFEGQMTQVWANYNLEGKDLKRQGEMINHPGRYRLDIQSDAAVTFVNRHHDEPFFLYLAYFAPHMPVEATPEYVERFPGEMPTRRRYALAMMSAIDDGVGRIVAALQAHGIEDDTLIIFLSDNGAPLKIYEQDHSLRNRGGAWNGSLNEPLKGEKGMLTEGGIRVPYIMRWKGRLPEGKVYDHPVISLDIAATAVALAGQDADPALDGVNLIPYLTGETEGAPHEALYWRWMGQSAIRVGRWKYLTGGNRDYLFDMDADAAETTNLATEKPEIMAGLRAKLEAWGAEQNPPGIERGRMRVGAEVHFDVYLDGKEPPPPKPLN